MIECDELTKAENVIATRKCRFKDFDSEYFDSIVTLSKRVKCPRCPARKGEICIGTALSSTGYRSPCHKSRLRILDITSKKVYSNLHYAMNTSEWKGDDVIVKVKGRWRIVSTKRNGWKRLVEQTYE